MTESKKTTRKKTTTAMATTGAAKITLDVVGNRPLIPHNGRLADPLNQYSQDLKRITSKRTKVDDDLRQAMWIEARGAAYETDDNLLGLPTANMWRCIYDASKFFKKGEDIKRALVHSGDTPALLVDGKTVDVDAYLSDIDHIFRIGVKQGKSTVMRSRPIVHNWSCTFDFELITEVINPRDLSPILDRASRFVGLGDWRPIYGTFDLEVS